MTLTGSEWDSTSVEIRWNSISGQLLGQGTGPSFSVQIVIPANAQPGVHYIVAMQPTNGRRIPSAFQVTADSSTKANTGGQTSASTSGADGGGEVEAGRASGATTGAEDGDASAPTATSGAAGTGQGPTGGIPSRTSAPAVAPAAASGTTERDPETARTGSQVAPASANPPAVADGKARVFGPSAPPTFADAAAAPGAAGADDLAARTVSGDLWSGFGAAKQGSNLLELPVAPESGGANNGLALTGVVFSASLVLLFAGFAVAEARRKRALAG